MKLGALFGLIVPILFFALPANAVSLRKMTLAEKIKASDLIVVGRVVGSGVAELGNVGKYRYVTLSLRGEIKGHAEGNVKVWTTTGMTEHDVECCQINKDYVFYLNKNWDGNYNITNHRYGVLELVE